MAARLRIGESICMASVVALALSGEAVQAQTTNEEPKADDREIVVTALKRETRLLETPLAISAINGEELERIGADGLEEFLQLTPGVAIDRSNNGNQNIYIRGLASSFGNSPIGFYIDEVPFTALTVTFTPDVRSFDLERVEVLRGPQGTLYGASSLGGTIRILTKDPVHNDVEMKADLFASSTHEGGDNFGAKGAINVPIVDDKLSLRVVATTEDYGGWIRLVRPSGATIDDHNGFDVWTVRAKLRYTPNDRLDVVLGYWHSDSFSDAGNVALDSNISSTLVNPLTPTAVVSDLYSAKIVGDLGFATLTSSTSQYDLSSKNLFVDFGDGFSDTQVSIFSQEIRLASNSKGRLFWTLGGIYTENETFIDFSFNLPGFFVNESTQDNGSTSYAVYGEATYSLTDQLDATVGLRYFRDRVTRNDTQFEVPLPEIETIYNDWSPRFNLAWTPRDGALFFATVSKGFRSGLTQPSIAIAAAQASVPPLSVADSILAEDAWNYEIGTKLQLFDKRLILDLVGYYINWEDLQQQVLLNPIVFAFVNAGNVKGYGFEGAVSLRATDNLTFNVTGSVNDTTYRETVRDAFGRTIFSRGDQVQFIPKHTISAAVDYRREIGDGWFGSVRGSVEHVGERVAYVTGAPPVRGEDNTRINFRMGAENKRFGIFAFVENLGNDQNRVNPVPGRAGYASRYRPRTVGINLQVNY